VVQQVRSTPWKSPPPARTFTHLQLVSPFFVFILALAADLFYVVFRWFLFLLLAAFLAVFFVHHVKTDTRDRE
jgi:hypothetical protein